MPVRNIAVVLAMMLSGCASAPPGTPGAGVGQTYTPIVDMQGVDAGRYSSDLAACRQYAGSVNVGQDQANAIAGGALFGAAIMAALGGNMRQIDQVATAGATRSLAQQTDRSLTKQQLIIGNCLAARGYRVLDGTANVSFVQGAPPAAPAVAPTSAPSVATAAALPITPAYLPPPADGIVRLPTPIMPPPTKPTGTDSYAAERVARAANCNGTGLANLVAKGPGYESYSMQCTNGDAMMIRCELGNCRALR